MGGAGGTLGSIGGKIAGGAGDFATSLGTSLGFVKPEVATIKASNAEKMLKKMAAETYAAGAPIRERYLTDALGLLKGDMDVTDLPGYATQMSLTNRGIGDAFGQARDLILENAPVGNQGAVVRGVEGAANAMAEKKATVAQMIADQMLNQYLGNAFGLATGGMTAGLGAMGNAGSLATQRAAAQAAAESAAAANQTNMFGNASNLFLGGARLYAGK